MDKDEPTGEVTHRLSLTFDVLYYRDGQLLKEPPDRVEAEVEAAAAIALHLETLFTLLHLMDTDRLESIGKGNVDTLFAHIGKLGMLLCDDLYSHVRAVTDEGQR